MDKVKAEGDIALKRLQAAFSHLELNEAERLALEVVAETRRERSRAARSPVPPKPAT